MSTHEFRSDVPHLQLKERVYLHLKKEIVDLKLRPGQSLREAELAERLGVSKTPLREAFVQLEKDDLVRIVPYKGAVVAGYDHEDLKEIYELRELLQGACAREAAERISAEDLGELARVVRASERAVAEGDADRLPELLDAFDLIIYRQTHNRRVRQLIENLQAHLQRIGKLTIGIPGRLDASVGQHAHIYEAILQRDPAEAERRMRNHIASVMADQLATFEDLGPPGR
jgi:DNA-binding GntR family transcriptional regulator